MKRAHDPRLAPTVPTDDELRESAAAVGARVGPVGRPACRVCGGSGALGTRGMCPVCAGLGGTAYVQSAALRAGILGARGAWHWLLRYVHGGSDKWYRVAGTGDNPSSLVEVRWGRAGTVGDGACITAAEASRRVGAKLAKGYVDCHAAGAPVPRAPHVGAVARALGGTDLGQLLAGRTWRPTTPEECVGMAAELDWSSPTDAAGLVDVRAALGPAAGQVRLYATPADEVYAVHAAADGHLYWARLLERA